MIKVDKNLNEIIKTGLEIGRLACDLDTKSQAYVLGIINTLLFVQEEKKG